VASCHPAQLVERVMDGIRVLDDVERYDDIRITGRQRDPVVEVCEQVRRRMNVEPDVAHGTTFERLPELLAPAPGVDHRAAPDPPDTRTPRSSPC
jgi:hypothetical protein